MRGANIGGKKNLIYLRVRSKGVHASAMFARTQITFFDVFGARFAGETGGAFALVTIGVGGARGSIFAWHRSAMIH